MEAATKLREGEDFFFKFTVTNKTAREFSFYPQYADGLIIKDVEFKIDFIVPTETSYRT
ncbi:hypothetical protein [Leadbetterella byssophila]|uniref:Uncharacterized protein n=1 Tax=Leadbetterella byssophila (strain DSM 17132 / JCM 16389 / KACC 11308 / NBRC 106382 / 4M15) TaxID=649349 RepID=E4RX44_LEAB4|nr:hypothetical protein [Leadbetterella byssophila]ADQ18083.1 hypothetical protein Lbys_2413 [Leadbetterella byssophila DSM 17132]